VSWLFIFRVIASVIWIIVWIGVGLYVWPLVFERYGKFGLKIDQKLPIPLDKATMNQLMTLARQTNLIDTREVVKKVVENAGLDPSLVVKPAPEAEVK
jgi:hypothetical protein